MTRTRKAWLQSASSELKDAGIDSARLDSELLLSHALGISRTALHAHEDELVDDATLTVLEAMLGLRVIRVPLAYIVGHREFYGRLFKVTPSVLIPRPETEDIIEIVKELPEFASIVDVGTGSGALAVTLALEHSGVSVTATDISQRALNVAQSNDATYQTGVTFAKTDLLDGVALAHPVCVVANLPYVKNDDARSPETGYEPGEALFADEEGLALIKRLIDQLASRSKLDDYLLLESNPQQHPEIIRYAIENGFAHEQTRNLITVFRR